MRLVSIPLFFVLYLSQCLPALALENDFIAVKSLPLTLMQGKQPIGDIRSLDGKAVITYADGKTQSLLDLPDPEERQYSEHIALQGDFNVDGLQDIAFFVSSGYAGVNQFYDLFVSDGRGRLTPLMEISNPSLNVEKQQLSTAQRSGPRWYETVYQFKEGRIIQHIDYSMIDASLFHREIYQGDKRLSSAVVSNQDAESNELLVRKITIDKATLYNQADESTATRMYVIKGDDVTLLDYKEPNMYDGWFFIRFNGRRVIEKWIRSDAVYSE